MKSKSKYYNEKADLFICECGREFLKGQSLNAHFCHCLIHRNGKPVSNKLQKLKESCNWSKGLTKESDSRIKNHSETLKRRFESGELQPSMLGKKLTKDHKENISLGRIKYLENNSNSTEWYSISNGKKEIKVQGTWELKVAEWLNSNNIYWIRKRIQFKGHRRYTPDFYLPNYDIWLEVKGYMKDQDVYKMKTVLEEHQIDLRIIEKKEIEMLDMIKSIKSFDTFKERYKNYEIDFNHVKIKY